MNDKFNCITSCQGVYADVNWMLEGKNRDSFEQISMKYNEFKLEFSENLQFDRTNKGGEGINTGRIMFL